MDPATLLLFAEGRVEYITQSESHSFRWAAASFYSYPLNFKSEIVPQGDVFVSS